MAITQLIQSNIGRSQFQGLFENVIEVEALYDPPSVNSNSFQAESVSVIGAKFGDFVIINFEADLSDLMLTAHVDAADSINIHLNNPTAGAVNLTAGYIHLILLRPIHLHP